jgi:hypothetical protein
MYDIYYLLPIHAMQLQWALVLSTCAGRAALVVEMELEETSRSRA